MIPASGGNTPIVMLGLLASRRCKPCLHSNKCKVLCKKMLAACILPWTSSDVHICCAGVEGPLQYTNNDNYTAQHGTCLVFQQFSPLCVRWGPVRAQDPEQDAVINPLIWQQLRHKVHGYQPLLISTGHGDAGTGGAVVRYSVLICIHSGDLV